MGESENVLGISEVPVGDLDQSRLVVMLVVGEHCHDAFDVYEIGHEDLEGKLFYDAIDA